VSDPFVSPLTATRATALASSKMTPVTESDLANFRGLRSGWMMAPWDGTEFHHPAATDLASSFRFGATLRATSDEKIFPLTSRLPFRFEPSKSVLCWVESGSLFLRLPGSLGRVTVASPSGLTAHLEPLVRSCCHELLPPPLIVSDLPTVARLLALSARSASPQVRAVVALWAQSVTFRGHRLSFVVSEILTDFFAAPAVEKNSPLSAWFTLSGSRSFTEAVATLSAVGHLNVGVEDVYVDACIMRDRWRFSRLLALIDHDTDLDRFSFTSAAVEFARQEQSAEAEVSLLSESGLWALTQIWSGDIATGSFDVESGLFVLQQGRPPRVPLGRGSTLRLMSLDPLTGGYSQPTSREVKVVSYGSAVVPADSRVATTVEFERMRKKDGSLMARWQIPSSTVAVLSELMPSPVDIMGREGRVMARLSEPDWVTGGIMPPPPFSRVPAYLLG
jgi:hypothetical protein